MTPEIADLIKEDIRQQKQVEARLKRLDRQVQKLLARITRDIAEAEARQQVWSAMATIANRRWHVVLWDPNADPAEDIEKYTRHP